MRFIIAHILLAVVGHAAEPQPWPKPVDTKIDFTVTPASKLPSDLLFDQISAEEREPHDVGVCWLDLNKDGIAELIIDSHEGGTGGSYKYIFARSPSGFHRIASWMGSVILIAPKNGYNQIESWSSAGGGQFSRMLFRYEKHRYHMVRIEDWRGFGEDEGWRFIRSRDPKEYDTE